MKEMTIATRFRMSTQYPWDLPIQLVRTEFSWDETSGFTMSGTWKGRLPQNGIYKFHWYSEVTSNISGVYNETKPIFTSSDSIVMICTFDSNGTWQASDWYYGNSIPGIIMHKDGVDDTRLFSDGASITFNQVLSKWSGNPQYSISLGNGRWRQYQLLSGQEKTLNSNPDSEFGVIKSFGRYFFCDRDVIMSLGADFSKGTQMLNMLSVQPGDIEQGGIYDFNKTAVSLGTDGKYRAMGTVLNGETKIFINKTDASAGSNRHGFMYVFGQSNDVGIDMEGGVTEYENGVTRTTPLIKNLSINQVVHPMTAFFVEKPDITTPNKINNYLMPSKVDFYNKKTSLRTAPLNNTLT